MRKTYRSKKDASGALDHRDVILTTDAKSSLFDAFYIQNLKQTKREISVCSMQFAASNKVRKRKYVRRVKEKTPPQIESMSRSTYLTPDKSIHLNRAPDLFDQLLNSSPADTRKEVLNKIQLHDKKTYSRGKKNKKINCWSSDSSDSDKENSIIVKNSSNIKEHKLLVENKDRKQKDDSIINIFNNLSVFKLENDNSPINVVESPIISRIKNNQHSKLNTSPLCSTPFNEKYRGKSIYKFSPITMNPESPKYSIVNENKENSLTDSQESILKEAKSNFSQLKNKSECCKADDKKTHDNISCTDDNVKELPFHLSGSAQITEEEPFFGFSNKLQEDIEINIVDRNTSKIYNSCTDNLPSEPQNGSTEVGLDNSLKENNEIPSTNATNNSISNETDNESLYDTCSSEESDNSSEHSTISKYKEPVIVLNQLNKSIFEKYYQQMPDCYLESKYDADKNESHSIQNDNHDTFEKYIDKSLSSEEENKIQADVDLHHDLSESFCSKVLEETCISFVTTRRRNKIKDFSILALDNSYAISENTNILDNNSVNELDRKENLSCDSKDIKDFIVNNNTSQDQETVIEDKPDLFSMPSYDLSIVDRVNLITTRRSSRLTNSETEEKTCLSSNMEISVKDSLISDGEGNEDIKPSIVLQPGKKWERSLSIYRRMTMMADNFDESILDKEDLKCKGRKYRQSVICTMEMQESKGSFNESINCRRSTFSSKPSRPSIKVIKENDVSRLSICSTTLCDDLQGFLNEDCDDTVIELSKLSIADCDTEVTVIENIHDTSHRAVTARDYVLRRCDQTDAILFDECYPDTVLKNCRKIGEGVYGEVFLWRARDGHARVLKVIPVAGNIKVNGENQKDFGEIISEIVIAMELSALRTPIDEIKQHIDEGNDIETLDLHSVENATDVFNEVLAVRCVYGSYPSRLLDLWDLYDECKGSENDNPATLPVDQQFIVLELANAGQDLESYQFTNAEQAYSIFKQVAYGLAVAEEAFQFEHRDLHWGNVLIQPSEEKFALFVLRGRVRRVARCGVAAALIDYSLSRLALRPARGAPLALFHDLAADHELFAGRGDYQFELYRLMRRALGNNWENYEPYTNVLWLHYTIDKMITSLRYSRPNTKIHKQYIAKLGILKEQLLTYRSATELVLTHNEL